MGCPKPKPDEIDPENTKCYFRVKCLRKKITTLIHANEVDKFKESISNILLVYICMHIYLY